MEDAEASSATEIDEESLAEKAGDFPTTIDLTRDMNGVSGDDKKDPSKYSCQDRMKLSSSLANLPRPVDWETKENIPPMKPISDRKPDISDGKLARREQPRRKRKATTTCEVSKWGQGRQRREVSKQQCVYCSREIPDTDYDSHLKECYQKNSVRQANDGSKSDTAVISRSPQMRVKTQAREDARAKGEEAKHSSYETKRLEARNRREDNVKIADRGKETSQNSEEEADCSRSPEIAEEQKNLLKFMEVKAEENAKAARRGSLAKWVGYGEGEREAALEFFRSNVEVIVELNLARDIDALLNGRVRFDPTLHCQDETRDLIRGVKWVTLQQQQILDPESRPVVGRINVCGDPHGDSSSHSNGLSYLRLAPLVWLRKRITFVAHTDSRMCSLHHVETFVKECMTSDHIRDLTKRALYRHGDRKGGCKWISSHLHPTFPVAFIHGPLPLNGGVIEALVVHRKHRRSETLKSKLLELSMRFGIKIEWEDRCHSTASDMPPDCAPAHEDDDRWLRESQSAILKKNLHGPPAE